MGDKLLKYLLCEDECFLDDSIKGTSDFVKHFTSLGPRDSKGRSLRDFDLKREMFRYPCSYLIYSDTINQLPKPLLNYVEWRLIRILKNEKTRTDFVHLSKEDRLAILEILSETKPSFREKMNRFEQNIHMFQYGNDSDTAELIRIHEGQDNLKY